MSFVLLVAFLGLLVSYVYIGLMFVARHHVSLHLNYNHLLHRQMLLSHVNELILFLVQLTFELVHFLPLSYLRILSVGVLLLGITSCSHKELCVNHHEHALRYNVNVVADYRCDWEERCEDGPDWKQTWPDHYVDYNALRPSVPEGLRVVTYNEAGDNTTHNINTVGGVVSLYAGYNDLLFYNNDTEYIIF